ncbi:hypothetical protein KOY48_00540 [Candidatus Minimicrobia naudis]|uniref:Uncharacterized protein n=1 Tax=Candidatus Minimicrobia naudis TaxID=2841263 RepID=A0A8F1MBK8_9BACT|nr:hypothetical protein KOY48_00540 [Candidatus Minimicrobia naudis]
MKSCTNALDNMIKSDNDIAKKYGEDLKKHYAEMKQYYVAAVAYRQQYVIVKIVKDNFDNLQKVLEDKANK